MHAHRTGRYRPPHGRLAVVRHAGRAVPRRSRRRARRARPGRGRRRAGRPRSTASRPRRVDDVRDARARRRSRSAGARAVHDRRDAVERAISGPRSSKASAPGGSRSARSTPRPTRATAGTSTARSSAPASTAIRGRRRSPPTCSTRQHPACAHLGDEWEWHDEVYQFRDLRPDAQVLLRVRDGELDLGRRRRPPARVRLSAGVVLHRGRRAACSRRASVTSRRRGNRPTYLRHLAGGLGWALGARRERGRRNFSNWAYWRLHLDAGSAARSVSRSTRPTRTSTPGGRVRALASTSCSGRGPQPVPLELETTEAVDCGTYTRERVVFDTEATMSVPAYLLVPHSRRDRASGSGRARDPRARSRQGGALRRGAGGRRATTTRTRSRGAATSCSRPTCAASVNAATGCRTTCTTATGISCARRWPGSSRSNAISGTCSARSTCSPRTRSSIPRASPPPGCRTAALARCSSPRSTSA